MNTGHKNLYGPSETKSTDKESRGQTVTNHYLNITQGDVLLNSKFNHIKHMKVEEATCKNEKGIFNM